MMIRKYLPESYHPEQCPTVKVPIIDVLQHHYKPFLQIFFLNLTFAAGFYTVFIYNPLWMQKFTHITKSYSLEINSTALLITILAMLASSALSNKIGRKPILLFSTAGVALLSYPLYSMMLSPSAYKLFIGQGGFAVLLGAFIGVIGVVMVENFDKNVRMSGVSVSFNLCFAMFGGTAPMVSTWLIHTTHDSLSVAWYLALVSAVSCIAALTLPETYTKELD
jgi:MHS family proline/betaine transporter-like MFS transporter